MSIKDTVTLSLEATADRSHDQNIIHDVDAAQNPLLRVLAIYGPNASGKSNIISALEFMISYVKLSHLYQPGMKVRVTPFKLDRSCTTSPSRFDLVYIWEDVKYIYSVELTREAVVYESLQAYYSQKPSLIFERKDTNDYRFPGDRSVLRNIASRTPATTLFLSSAAQWNYDRVVRAHEWFTSYPGIITTEISKYLSDVTAELMETDEDVRRRLIEAIREADFGIFDIVIERKKEMDIPKALPLLLKMQILGQKHYDVYFSHSGKGDDGGPTTERFRLGEESQGTIRYFRLLGPMVQALSEPSLLVIDEFDTKMHPHMLRYILNMFQDPDINRVGSQLIVATHATSLLDGDILRKDQIWFTEKKDDGSTDLFSLADFHDRSSDLERAYHTGRFGAVPELGPGALE